MPAESDSSGGHSVWEARVKAGVSGQVKDMVNRNCRPSQKEVGCFYNRKLSSNAPVINVHDPVM